MLQEQLLWIPSRGERMAAVMHLPRQRTPAPAVLLLHGFTGTKVEPHRLFVKAARRLAAAGFAALRFDFLGSGDSEGNFEEMTIGGEVQDALNALSYLRELSRVDAKRVGLLGLSLGGCVTALSLPKAGDVRAVVLWAPVSNPLKWAQEEIPAKPVDWGGNLIGPDFFKELPSVKPLETAKSYAGPVLLLHGSNDASVPISSSEAYLEAFQSAQPKELHVIPDADHTFNRTDWESSVIKQSTDWFMKHL